MLCRRGLRAAKQALFRVMLFGRNLECLWRLIDISRSGTNVSHHCHAACAQLFELVSLVIQVACSDKQ